MENPKFEKVPLGPEPKMVKISKEEMRLAYAHRVQTGEPIQTWIRRLIRENWQVPGSARFVAHRSVGTPQGIQEDHGHHESDSLTSQR